MFSFFTCPFSFLLLLSLSLLCFSGLILTSHPLINTGRVHSRLQFRLPTTSHNLQLVPLVDFPPITKLKLSLQQAQVLMPSSSYVQSVTSPTLTLAESGAIESTGRYARGSQHSQHGYPIPLCPTLPSIPRHPLRDDRVVETAAMRTTGRGGSICGRFSCRPYSV